MITLNGYKGLLLGKSVNSQILLKINMKYFLNMVEVLRVCVKLTNLEDCVKKNYIKANPLQILLSAKRQS